MKITFLELKKLIMEAETLPYNNPEKDAFHNGDKVVTIKPLVWDSDKDEMSVDQLLGFLKIGFDKGVNFNFQYNNGKPYLVIPEGVEFIYNSWINDDSSDIHELFIMVKDENCKFDFSYKEEYKANNYKNYFKKV